MTFSVEAAIDRWVEEQSPPRPFDGLWHPSSISGCLRKAIYEMRQVDETNPKGPRQKRVLFLGSRFHEMAQAAVASWPGVAEVYTEVKVHIPELNIGGAADQLVLITVVMEDGSAELEEFKTINGWGFRALKAPKEDHAKQVKPYVMGLREVGGVAEDGRVVPALGNRLKTVRFTYIDKEKFDTKEFVVDYDPSWDSDVRERIAELEAYREHPWSLPPRLPKNGKKVHWMCDWGWGQCPFFDRCWHVDPDEISLDF